MGQGCESCCTNKDAEGELNYGSNNNQYNNGMNGTNGGQMYNNYQKNNNNPYNNGGRMGSQAKANGLRESKTGLIQIQPTNGTFHQNSHSNSNMNMNSSGQTSAATTPQ